MVMPHLVMLGKFWQMGLKPSCEWHVWFADFKRYMSLSKHSNQDDQSKLELLRYLLGVRAKKVINNINNAARSIELIGKIIKS